MNHNLQIQSRAIIDIQEAFEWYEKQKDGLGFEFIEEVENGYENICKHQVIIHQLMLISED